MTMITKDEEDEKNDENNITFSNNINKDKFMVYI